MLRTLLAVALAAALVAVAIPVVEDARVRRSDRVVHGEIAAVRRAAAALLAAEEVAPGAGARRTVELSLPRATRGSARTVHLSIVGDPATRRATITYRIEGGSERRVRVDAPLYTPDGPVAFDGGGRRRVTLSLVRVDGDLRVLVERDTPPPSVGRARSDPGVARGRSRPERGPTDSGSVGPDRSGIG